MRSNSTGSVASSRCHCGAALRIAAALAGVDLGDVTRANLDREAATVRRFHGIGERRDRIVRVGHGEEVGWEAADSAGSQGRRRVGPWPNRSPGRGVTGRDATRLCPGRGTALRDGYGVTHSGVMSEGVAGSGITQPYVLPVPAPAVLPQVRTGVADRRARFFAGRARARDREVFVHPAEGAPP